MPDHGKVSRDFPALYRRTLQPLRRYLLRLLGNRPDAQDVAHDAYARVFRAMEEEKARQPEGLLFTTARRLAINELRKRDRATVRSVDAEILALTPADHPSVEDRVMAQQEWAATEAAITRLPIGCRTVLLLCKFEGLTHAEVASQLGISPKTVEKQHARALRLLRVSLAAFADPVPTPASPRASQRTSS
jgi:RNA polymerase sigma-70 factor (ECF subfamily)